MDVICSRVRPTWDEIMGMDAAMAEAVLARLPRLDDGSQALVSLASLFGGSRK